MHYSMSDVKDMGQQMGYRCLEWNWPKEAINIPIGAGIVDGAKLFKPFTFLVNNSLFLTPYGGMLCKSDKPSIIIIIMIMMHRNK